MKILHLFITSCLVFFIVACSPKIKFRSHFKKDKDFSRTATYYWSPLQEIVKPGQPLYDNQVHREMIKKAIEKEMQRKGFKKDSLSPDLRIEYFIKLEDKRSVITAPLPYIDSFDQEYRVKVEQLKKGSLVIHLENASGTESIWLGSAEGTVEAIPTDISKKINHTVKKIFSTFPYKAGSTTPETVDY
ncbi:MAG: DUF4136 domain-containing protein [Bacteroidota bacterium]